MKNILHLGFFLFMVSCVSNQKQFDAYENVHLRTPAAFKCEDLFKNKTSPLISLSSHDIYIQDVINQFKLHPDNAREFSYLLEKFRTPDIQNEIISKITQFKNSSDPLEQKLFQNLKAQPEMAMREGKFALFKNLFGPQKLSFNEILNDKNKETVLYMVTSFNARGEHADFFNYVIKQPEVNIHAETVRGESIIDLAFLSNNEAMALSLIQHKQFDPNKYSRASKEMGFGDYLSISIEKNQTQVSLELLKNKKFAMLDLNRDRHYRMSYLNKAITKANSEVVKMLLKNPEIASRINDKNSKLDPVLGEMNDGKTALHYALGLDLINTTTKNTVESARDMIFDVLEVPGLDINLKDAQGNTAIYELSSWSTIDAILRPLLFKTESTLSGRIQNRTLKTEFKIDVNSINLKKQTALQHHIYNRNYDAALILLSVPGINITNRDVKNKTALDLTLDRLQGPSNSALLEIQKKLVQMGG